MIGSKLVNTARGVTGRQGQVNSAIGHLTELVMNLNTIIQQARFRSDTDNKWNSLRAGVENLKYHIDFLYNLGAITEYDYERGEEKSDMLMNLVERRESEGLGREARDMWTYIKDIQRSISRFCLNPKAVAVKRGVAE